MMKKIYLILALLFFVNAFAAGAIENLDEIRSLDDIRGLSQEDLMSLKNAYNQNIDQVPSAVNKIVGNERINLHISSQDGDVELHAVLNNGLMEELNQGRLDDETLDIETDEATFNAVLSNSLSWKNALDEGRIRIKFKSFWKKIVFGILKMFI